MSREIMQQALDQLKRTRWASNCEAGYSNDLVIAALETALAQPEQEPVAWNGWVLREVFFDDGYPLSHREPPKQWVGLTDDEVAEVERWVEFKEAGSGQIVIGKLVRYIELKLRSKNNAV